MRLILTFLLLLLPLYASDPGIAGQWQGTLRNLPERPGRKSVAVTREIGTLPSADGECTVFRTSYIQEGSPTQSKEYRLCQVAGPDNLVVDEGNDVRLPAQWLGGVLVSSIKYDSILLISQMRRRGDVLEEEILTMDDKPAIKGVLPLVSRSIQLLSFTRAK